MKTENGGAQEGRSPLQEDLKGMVEGPGGMKWAAWVTYAVIFLGAASFTTLLLMWVGIMTFLVGTGVVIMLLITLGWVKMRRDSRLDNLHPVPRLAQSLWKLGMDVEMAWQIAAATWHLPSESTDTKLSPMAQAQIFITEARALVPSEGALLQELDRFRLRTREAMLENLRRRGGSLPMVVSPASGSWSASTLPAEGEEEPHE